VQVLADAVAIAAARLESARARGAFMRIVLADLASADGFVSKDTVVGGYGSRLRPFSRVTRLVCAMKRQLHDLPSVQLGYLAAVCAAAGHEVVYTEGAPVEGDVAIVLTSLVDHRNEAVWADAQRRRGLRVGFVGLTASKLPELFDAHGDFVILGEPETAVTALAKGRRLEGRVQSPPLEDLDSLPFPRWETVGGTARQWWSPPFAGRPAGGAFPVLASRGCPEFCTYCPHRILASHRTRSPESITDELEYLTTIRDRPYVVFRDPLFTSDRERCLALCDEIRARGLNIRFECETRLDRLDPALLESLRKAGLAAISFGVETIAVETLRRAGRRPIPPEQQRRIMAECRSRGIVTAAFYVFGFLQDDWSSIAATIDYAIDLGSTVAQFKLLTPYPGTPMWRQLAPLVYEKDWQRFDGYTPTFTHPSLTARELSFLLGAAYTRFYMRPSCVANYCRLQDRGRRMLARFDERVLAWHERGERAAMARGVTC
jgi:anaerobic magnesium-protoporphyrin IX monomethyl ester cyclase